MLKNLGTLYKTKKSNRNFVLRFIFICHLNKTLQKSQVFSELYRYKKGKNTVNTHTQYTVYD